MKCIGLIGALDALTPRIYWDVINEEVGRLQGRGEMANLLASSLSGTKLRELLIADNWKAVERALVEEARIVHDAGAEGLVICSSALAPARTAVSRAVELPIICVGTSVGQGLQKCGFHRAVILGTRTKREEQWWNSFSNITWVHPKPEEWRELKTYLDDGCYATGQALEGSHIENAKAISRFRREHAQVVVLVAPQLARLFPDQTSILPIFDAVDLHARAAAAWAIEGAGQTSLPTSNCMLDAP